MVSRQLAADEVGKVRAELARHAEFTEISRQVVEVNERICEARTVAGTGTPSVPVGEKGDLRCGRGGVVRWGRAVVIGRPGRDEASSPSAAKPQIEQTIRSYNAHIVRIQVVTYSDLLGSAGRALHF